MKNKIFTLMLCALAAQGADAKVRTTRQMIGEAARVLATKANSMKAKANGELKVLKREKQLSIVGYEGGRRVVIANDDTFKPVLAYYDAVPEGAEVPALNWWLEAMNQSLDEQLADGVLPYDVERKANYKESVEPMLKTEWGQGAPFNNLTPTYTSGSKEEHYVTGCVATAMAQVLRYHEYPAKGKGYNKWLFYPNGENADAVSTRVNFTSTYDWDNMIKSYEGKYTDEQAKAVATLMRDCGAASSMQYTPSGSGSTNNAAINGMRKNLKFDYGTKNYIRLYTPKSLWMDIIYEELSEGRPIMYGGSTSSGSGHEFVFDGYDKDGLVHVDWGWSGTGNGYFDVALLNSQEGSFSEMQDMIVVRVPGQTNKGYHSMFVTSGVTATVSKNVVNLEGAVIANMDDMPFTGQIGIMAVNTATGEPAVYVDRKTLKSIGHGYGFKNYSLGFDASTLSDGEYQLFFATHSTDEDLVESGWYPVYSNENIVFNYTLTVANGKYTVKEGDSDWYIQTGIKHTAISNNKKTSGAVYSIDGRVMGNDINAMGKGLYIVDGKKVMK